MDSPVLITLIERYGLWAIMLAFIVYVMVKQFQDTEITRRSAADSRQMMKESVEETAQAYVEVIDSLKAHLASQETTIVRLREENVELRAVQHTLTEDLRQLSEDHRDALDAVEEGHAQRKEMLGKIDKMQGVIDAMRAENRELRARVEELTKLVESHETRG